MLTKKIHNTYRQLALLFIGFSMLLSCSENQIIDQNYLKLSVTTYSFDASGTEELVIHIDAYPEWEVELPESEKWLSEIERGTDFIKLKAEENLGVENRFVELLFSSGKNSELVTITQQDKYELANYVLLDNMNRSTISMNGKYIGTFSLTAIGGNQVLFTITRIDLETGNKENVISTLENINMGPIADNGTIVVYSNESQTTSLITTQNEVIEVEVPTGYSSSFINAISADGSVLAGSIKKERKTIPAKWVNNKCEELPIPERDIMGNPPFGVISAKGCSADGSVIFGNFQILQTMIYWKDGNVFIAGEDIIEESTIEVQTPLGPKEERYVNSLRSKQREFTISPNGRYIAGYYGVSEDKKPMSYPAVFDTHTKQTSIVRDFPNGAKKGGDVTGVTDDGELYYGTHINLSETPLLQIISEGFVYDMNTKQSVSSSDYILNKYGIKVKKTNMFPLRFCTDNQTLYGIHIEKGPTGFINRGWYIKAKQ